MDLFLSLDTDKLGLWPGGLFTIHGESSFGVSSLRDAGTLIPVNHDNTMPNFENGQNWGLPQVFLTQALSENFAVTLGKLNAGGLADMNEFANNERSQFMNTALVNNPMLGGFIPYTTWAALGTFTMDGHQLVAGVANTEGSATVWGFDDAFKPGYTFAVEYSHAHRAFDLPGNVRVGVLYTNEPARNLRITEQQLAGLDPLKEEDSNQAYYVNFDQYVFLADEEEKRGLGVFGRAGYGDDDTNVVDRFFSFGMGGKGLVRGRPGDRFGLGWYYAHTSDKLHDTLKLIGRNPTQESGWELFYNFELTPAVHLTADVQYITNPFGSGDPPRAEFDDKDSALVIGARLQIDF